MIQITPQHKILIYPPAMDFRKGMDKIIGFCRAYLQDNPLSGALFCFRNSTMTAVKILVYDGTGFWLCHKRFSQGTIMHWPRSQSEAATICATELQVIINQGKVQAMASSWHPLPGSRG